MHYFCQSNQMSIVQNKRLKILQSDFSTNPLKTIHSFIGNDAKIESYKVNNIYIDGYIIVDVVYSHLDINPCKIYWVKYGDCKPLNIKKTNACICTIDGWNVCVIINQTYPPDTWIAMTIKPTISTQRGEVFYKYFGTIVDTPFHEANTQVFDNTLKEVTEDLSKCNVDTVLFEEAVIRKSYNDINNKFTYKSTLQAMTSQEVIRINSLKEGVDKNKLYVIDVRQITDIGEYKGYLSCAPYREHPWDVLFINIPNYQLTERKLNNLKSFMLNDYRNYVEWVEKIDG